MYNKSWIKRRIFSRYKISLSHLHYRVSNLLNNVNNDYKKSFWILKKKDKEVSQTRERHKKCLIILKQDTSSKVSKRERNQLINWHWEEFQKQDLYLREIRDLMFIAKERSLAKNVAFSKLLMEENYNRIFKDFATFQKQIQKFVTPNQKNNLPTLNISPLGIKYASEVWQRALLEVDALE